jgi:PAS domain S-box-containing protein
VSEPDARSRDALFLESIVENLPMMVFVKEARDLRFALFNRAGEALLGWNRDQLIGKNDYDFFPKDQADFFTSKDREVLAGRAVVDIPEEPIDTRLLGRRWLHTWKIPILDPATQTPLYLLGISEDITDRRSAEEELVRRTGALRAANVELQRKELQARSLLAQARAVGRQLPGAVWTTDSDLALTSLYGARLAGLGMHPVESIGRRITDLPAGHGAAAEEAHAAALRDESGAYDLRIGDRRYEVTVEPHTDGMASGVVAVALDVTGRRGPTAALPARRVALVGAAQGRAVVAALLRRELIDVAEYDGIAEVPVAEVAAVVLDAPTAGVDVHGLPIPVIALIPHGAEAAVRGAAATLAKPIRASALADAVRGVLGG